MCPDKMRKAGTMASLSSCTGFIYLCPSTFLRHTRPLGRRTMRHKLLGLCWETCPYRVYAFEFEITRPARITTTALEQGISLEPVKRSLFCALFRERSVCVDVSYLHALRTRTGSCFPRRRDSCMRSGCLFFLSYARLSTSTLVRKVST